MTRQELLKLDREINDLMSQVEIGEATKEEVKFLQNLLTDLRELFMGLSE